MAEPTRSYFAAITDIAENCLNKIRFRRMDANSDRSVWEVHGNLSEELENFALRKGVSGYAG